MHRKNIAASPIIFLSFQHIVSALLFSLLSAGLVSIVLYFDITLALAHPFRASSCFPVMIFHFLSPAYPTMPRRQGRSIAVEHFISFFRTCQYRFD